MPAGYGLGLTELADRRAAIDGATQLAEPLRTAVKAPGRR
jgi:hypothetical protein